MIPYTAKCSTEFTGSTWRALNGASGNLPFPWVGGGGEDELIPNDSCWEWDLDGLSQPQTLQLVQTVSHLTAYPGLGVEVKGVPHRSGQ